MPEAGKLIDGKAIAAEIRREIREEVSRRVALGRTPGLAVIVVGDNPASKVYVNMKKKACEEAGMNGKIVRLPAGISQEELLQEVSSLNRDPKWHGFLVQSPLPDGLDEDEVVRAIDPMKDVDGFHPYNVGLLAAGEPRFVPCTPLGVMELLERCQVDPAGKHAVIIGRSHIVGLPMSLLLVRKAKGANATVTICHSRTQNLPEITRQADILVAAIGRANFVTPEMIKPGAVVIDVGINRLEDPSKKSGYRLVGDVDFQNVREKTSWITPVPGGVGPMTVALLLKNTLLAEELQSCENDR